VAATSWTENCAAKRCRAGVEPADPRRAARSLRDRMREAGRDRWSRSANGSGRSGPDTASGGRHPYTSLGTEGTFSDTRDCGPAVLQVGREVHPTPTSVRSQLERAARGVSPTSCPQATRSRIRPGPPLVSRGPHAAALGARGRDAGSESPQLAGDGPGEGYRSARAKDSSLGHGWPRGTGGAAGARAWGMGARLGGWRRLGRALEAGRATRQVGRVSGAMCGKLDQIAFGLPAAGITYQLHTLAALTHRHHHRVHPHARSTLTSVTRQEHPARPNTPVHPSQPRSHTGHRTRVARHDRGAKTSRRGQHHRMIMR